ncbi:MAG TPA: hypothetical protein VIJ25_10880 [Methylococcales bacterium]
MNENYFENKPGRQTSDPINEPQTPTPPEPAATSTKAEKSQPNRFQRFIRKALTWLVVLAVFFIAGFATDYFLRYRPLQAELNTATAHSELLQILVDVSNARLALALNDIGGAKAALSNTQQRLDVLLPRISVFNSNLAQSMPQRLGLIVSGLDRDPETAKIDLGLITNDLLQIETALFSR